MGIIRKMRAPFHEDWCKNCTKPMMVMKKELFMLPVLVDHYVSHEDAAYFKKNLIKISKKADIPTGYHGCGIIKYHCSNCNYDRTRVKVFLPVRDIEKFEDMVYYEKGELDSIL